MSSGPTWQGAGYGRRSLDVPRHRHGARLRRHPRTAGTPVRVPRAASPAAGGAGRAGRRHDLDRRQLDRDRVALRRGILGRQIRRAPGWRDALVRGPGRRPPRHAAPDRAARGGGGRAPRARPRVHPPRWHRGAGDRVGKSCAGRRPALRRAGPRVRGATGGERRAHGLRRRARPRSTARRRAARRGARHRPGGLRPRDRTRRTSLRPRPRRLHARALPGPARRDHQPRGLGWPSRPAALRRTGVDGDRSGRPERALAAEQVVVHHRTGDGRVVLDPSVLPFPVLLTEELLPGDPRTPTSQED